jgi:hypothetical protein
VHRRPAYGPVRPRLQDHRQLQALRPLQRPRRHPEAPRRRHPDVRVLHRRPRPARRPRLRRQRRPPAAL